MRLLALSVVRRAGRTLFVASLEWWNANAYQDGYRNASSSSKCQALQTQNTITIGRKQFGVIEDCEDGFQPGGRRGEFEDTVNVKNNGTNVYSIFRDERDSENSTPLCVIQCFALINSWPFRLPTSYTRVEPIMKARRGD